MKSVKKAYNGLGLIALSVVFLLLYGYFNATGGRPPVALNNSTRPTLADGNTVGAIGGFHLLENMSVSEEEGYYRLTLATKLNRSTIIDQKISVPLTRVMQVAASELTWINNRYQDTSKLGSYRLQVTMSDTGLIDQPDGVPVTVFRGEKTLVVDRDPITTIQLVDSPDGLVNQILVGLKSEAKFRVSSTPTGTIYIDILK